MTVISKKLLLSCSLAAFLTISSGSLFANDLATEITEEVVSIAAETMLRTPINVGRGKIDEPSDLLDLPINGIIDSIVKKSLEKSIGTLVERGIIQGSGDVWVDRIAARVLTQVRSSLSSGSGVSGKLNSATAGTFATGILVGVTLDIASEVVEEELVSAGHPYLGPAIGYGIQQGKVAYAAKTGGPLGAVVAQTMITGKQIGRVYQLSLELEEEMNDARAAAAYSNAASDALRLRSRYMQADSKPQIESQIRREMRDSLSDYYGDDLPPEAEHYIDSIIYQYQSAEVRKYEVAQGLAEEILQNPENAGAYRDRAEEFISRNFSSDERNRLTSLTNDLYASIASDQVTEMRSLLNGLVRSETPEEDRQRLIALAKSVDPELYRIKSEQRLLETIVQNLEKYERAFGQDTTAIQVLTETSGVISGLERKTTTPSEPDLCDSFDCNSSLAEAPREELPTGTNADDAERLAAEQERLEQEKQAELDRQKEERRIAEERRREAERQAALEEAVTERGELEGAKAETEHDLQEARNLVTVLRYQEAEKAQNELREIASEIQSLRDRKQASVGFDNLKFRQGVLRRELEDLQTVIRFRRGITTPSAVTDRQKQALNRVAQKFGIRASSSQEAWQRLMVSADRLMRHRINEFQSLNTRIAEIEATGEFTAADERRFQRLLRREQELERRLDTLSARLRIAEANVDRLDRQLRGINQDIADSDREIASLRRDGDAIDLTNFSTQKYAKGDWGSYSIYDDYGQQSVNESADTSDESNETTVDIAVAVDPDNPSGTVTLPGGITITGPTGPSDPVDPEIPAPHKSHIGFFAGANYETDGQTYLTNLAIQGVLSDIREDSAGKVGFKLTDACISGCSVTGATPDTASNDYQYLSWGTLDNTVRMTDTDTGITHDIQNMRWLYGDATSQDYLNSRTGIATYSGNIFADLVVDEQTLYGAVTGGIGLSFNFSDDTLAGEGFFALNGGLPQESFTVSGGLLTQGGHQYLQASLKGQQDADNTGGLLGSFYGPDANELAGALWYFGDWEFADDAAISGIFTTKPGGFVMPEVSGENNNTRVVAATIEEHVILYGVADTDVQSSQGNTLSLATGGDVIKTSSFNSTGYSYTTWGEWEAPSTNAHTDYSQGGQWVSTETTSPDVIERRTGTASYSGDIVGSFVTPGAGGIRDSAKGLINIEADFSNSSVSGQFQFGHDCGGSGGGGPSGCRTVSSVATFNEQINDYGGSGFGDHTPGQKTSGSGVVGIFAGPNAEEIGGNAWLEDNGGMYSGVFIAK